MKNSVRYLSAFVAMGMMVVLFQNATSGPIVKIYMSPNGNDIHDGSTYALSVKTLERVQQLVKAQTKSKNSDVEVLVDTGRYEKDRVKWTYTMLNNSITFRALKPNSARPIFDGCKKLANGTLDCLYCSTSSSGVTTCDGAVWFSLRPSKVDFANPAGNIHIDGMRIVRYRGGVSLGSKEFPTSSNSVVNCSFSQIGNTYDPDKVSYGFSAVGMSHASNNKVTDNTFVEIVNKITTKTPRDPKHSTATDLDLRRLIHGLYLAHDAHNNVIARNQFVNISGVAVKLRDNSNGNLITGNSFSKIADGPVNIAAYSDWYSRDNKECPSWDNTFSSNLLDGNYNCNLKLPATDVRDFEIYSHCPIRSGKRVTVKNNSSTASFCEIFKSL